LWHAFKAKAPLYFKSWVLAQLIISFTLATVLFVNKGYCIFASCEPTNTIKAFIDINFDQTTVIVLKLINLTLLFSVIAKMHDFIEKHREKWQKRT
jgi:hypothetical protein